MRADFLPGPKIAYFPHYLLDGLCEIFFLESAEIREEIENVEKLVD